MSNGNGLNRRFHQRATSLPIYGRCSLCFEVSSFQIERCKKRCHRQGCKGDDLAVAGDFLEHVCGLLKLLNFEFKLFVGRQADSETDK